jgi:chromosomal replication initiator protein
MENKINPYVYPGIDLQKLDLTKYPSLNSVVKLSEEDVLEMVCQYYGVTQDNVVGKSRKRIFVEPRIVFSYILRMKFDKTLRHIGEVIGDRDHSSISHYIETFYCLFNTNKNFKNRCKNVLLASGVDFDNV